MCGAGPGYNPSPLRGKGTCHCVTERSNAATEEGLTSSHAGPTTAGIHHAESGRNNERHIFDNCERPVVRLTPEHVRSRCPERYVNNPFVVWRWRGRSPARCGWRIRAVADVLPGQDLLRGERNCTGAAINEPQHTQASRAVGR